MRELGHTHLSRAKVEKVLKEGLGHTSRRELEGTWSHTPVKRFGTLSVLFQKLSRAWGITDHLL